MQHNWHTLLLTVREILGDMWVVRYVVRDALYDLAATGVMI